MIEPSRAMPSIRQFAFATAQVAAAICLVVTIAVNVHFVVVAVRDPGTSAGDVVLASIMGLIYFGPVLVVTAWPISVPVVAVLGTALAFLRLRRQEIGGPPERLAIRLGRVALGCYATTVLVIWLMWLLAARSA